MKKHRTFAPSNDSGATKSAHITGETALTSTNYKNMKIRDLASVGNIQVVVTTADLREFALQLIDEAKKIRDNDEAFYTAREFAARHGVSTNTLWRWERAGILKGTRRGSRVFYRESDLIEK